MFSRRPIEVFLLKLGAATHAHTHTHTRARTHCEKIATEAAESDG